MKYLLALLISFSSFAQTRITFDQITYTGTGCEQGSVSSLLSPDGTTMSLLFDEWRVEVPNYQVPPIRSVPGRGPNYRPQRSEASEFVSHKTCNITFLTTLPVGAMATGIEISVQARGNTMIDQGINAYFSTILVGHRGLANSSEPQAKVIDKRMWISQRTTVEEDWITNPIVAIPLNSGCASPSNRQIKFELKNHLEARIVGNDLRKAGIVTIDSHDSSGVLSFSLKTQNCGGRLAPKPARNIGL
jgi:hypothetical protein